MSERVNKEQTKDAKLETITELSDEQLGEAVGGALLNSDPIYNKEKTNFHEFGHRQCMLDLGEDPDTVKQEE